MKLSFSTGPYIIEYIEDLNIEMNQEQISNIVKFELQKGTPPQDVCDMAISAGVPAAQIRGVFMDILPYKEVGLLQLGDKLETPENLRRDKVLKESSEKNIFWDPVKSDIYLGKFANRRMGIKEKFKFFQERFYVLKLVFLALFLLGVGVWAMIAYWYYLDSDSATKFLFGDGHNYRGGIWILLFCWVPFFVFLAYVKSLQADLVKDRIAEKKKWVYNPDESASHWASLRDKFPSVFAQGTEKQNVQDEIWGKYRRGNQDIDFYSGIFEYHVVKGFGSKRSSSRYYQTFFGIHLKKKLKKNLVLTSNSTVKKIFKLISSEKMELESVEFNNIYSVEYGGEITEKLNIFKMLSPAVQWELIRLGKESKGLKILFSEDTFLFVRDGFLFESPNVLFKILFKSIPLVRNFFLRQMNSNFIKRVEVNPRDEAFLEAKIESLLRIAVEIPQYLD